VKIKKNVFDRNPPPADAFSEPPPVKQETTSRGKRDRQNHYSTASLCTTKNK
jgi:hypothetical protein